MNLINPIAKGNTAEIYLCEGKIMKLFLDRFSIREAEYEAGKQKLVYSCGLPVPRVMEVCHVDGRPAIIMEYVQGRNLR